ncbi:MAG: translation elongation factor Ts [Acidimicrobiia bacterium]
MADFAARDVQELRRVTGVGMMDAKGALVETGGDFEKAKEYLREKGLSDAKKRAGREANDGVIGMYIHRQLGRPVIGVLVELASETDFVAKSEEFQAIANDVAMHVAAAQPRWVRRADVPQDALEYEREMITRQAHNEGKPENIIPRIVEGRIGSFYKDTVLEEQQFVKNDQFDGTVGEMVARLAATMGENISIRRFARLAVGEET